MPEDHTRLITISREFGAGGSVIAAELGVRLGWPVLDQDLIHRVAERLRLDDTTIAQLDEHPPSFLARIAAVLIIPQPDIFSFTPPTDLTNPDEIAEASRAIIAEAGKSPPVIIVGHGAQCIFSNREDALHVRVIAPIKTRLLRVMQRLDVDAAYATALLKRADADRQAYVRRYFQKDLHNELLYDLLINTGRLAIDEAVEVVTNIARGRQNAHTSSTPHAARIP